MGHPIYEDLFFEKRDFIRIVLEPDRIEELSSGVETGLAVRKITSDFENKLTYITQDISTYLKQTEFNLLPKDEKREFISLIESSSKTSTFDIDSYLSLLERIKSRVPNSYVKHYRIGLMVTFRETHVLTSEGRLKSQISPYFRVLAVVVAEQDGRLERGYEVKGYRLSPDEALRLDTEIELLGEKAAKLALSLLSARKAPAGVMPVILAGTAGGTMIHEAVGHGLEADHGEEGLSIYSGRIGERVASPLITVIDDPTIPALYGSYLVDDEGVEAKKTALIEEGILKTFLYDKFTALKHGKESNGHGRRQSFRNLPIPRMSNTYIAPGKDKVEDILKSINKGLLVKKMGGGEVNPLTGDFVFEVREGYYIDKGEIAYSVKGATLVGNGPKVLETIDMVADDLHFEPGTCGKDGQGVPVSDGQPSMRIPEIVVGGVLD
ncbi:MAG: TldD/PmbA family protein [Caldimicrobium sp.]|nr:TldD/PmbA family protein [Caldimicrobium sp.]MCX7613785.1 TldD/PmbA family protein [Caldimicrobium sp.]MDW8182612.1 TldD/PmbA family protein [Caldimicrobium sp.]